MTGPRVTARVSIRACPCCGLDHADLEFVRTEERNTLTGERAWVFICSTTLGAGRVNRP